MTSDSHPEGMVARQPKLALPPRCHVGTEIGADFNVEQVDEPFNREARELASGVRRRRSQ